MTNWIRERRKKLNISQDQLAVKLQVRGFNISRSTVANWEQGRHRAPLDDPEFTRALADALEMSVVAVLQNAGYDLNRYGMSAAASRAAALIDGMPPSRQTLAIDIIEKLASESN